MLTLNIYYTGKDDAARKFVDEMEASGLVNKIREEQGNLRYKYFYSKDDPETVLLIDQWVDQAALDIHHQTPMMTEIAKLRDKYKLKMKVDKFITIDKERI